MYRTKFAIVQEKVQATVLEGDEYIELTRGMMVELKEERERNCTIIVHDYYEKNYAFENNLYWCKTSSLMKVYPEIWHYLIAITDPIMRANLAKDRPFLDYIANLQINTYVTVNGSYFNISVINQSLMFLPEREPKERTTDYDCMIRYIGPVDEIGPGFNFGLELLVISRYGIFQLVYPIIFLFLNFSLHFPAR